MLYNGDNNVASSHGNVQCVSSGGISLVNIFLMVMHVSGHMTQQGAQWLSGRVLDSRPKGCGFKPHRHHCVVSLSKNNIPSLVLVHPRKTRPFITERLLMGCKESNQTKTKYNTAQ